MSDHQRRGPVARDVASAMAAAAARWLDSLSPSQRLSAHWTAPGSEAEAERRRWFYTPTDHGGLPISAQTPAQQSLALQVLSAGLSLPAYVTICAVMGLENVLDQVEGFAVHWGRERGRDPGLYYLRVFGDPGDREIWGWRFGGHHVSLNFLVVEGRVEAVTPCFIGADPAASPLLGSASLRPLGASEDLARALIRSLPPRLQAIATLSDRAPSDIVSGNRSRIAEGDQMMHIRDVWRSPFTDPELVRRIDQAAREAEAVSGLGPEDHQRLALTGRAKGLSAARLTQSQRDLLSMLLDTYFGRVPAGLITPPDLDTLHVAWAGSSEEGQPHYYRIQGPRLLIEWDNTQHDANHAHSVWRDPEADFGLDVLAGHQAAHHAD